MSNSGSMQDPFWRPAGWHHPLADHDTATDVC